MKILRLPEVKQAFGHRSDASPYNDIRDGLLTAGIAIGQRAKGWPDYEIEAIISARIAGASDDQIRALVKSLHGKRIELAQAMGIPVESTEARCSRGPHRHVALV